jgi:hypothetical protein
MSFRISFFLLLILRATCVDALGADCDETVTGQIRLDSGHPWRPPFGLDRIGRPLTAIAEIAAAERPYREYWLSAYRGDKEIDRQLFHLTGSHLTGKSPYTGNASFSEFPDELVLFARCRFQGEPTEITRLKVPAPNLEADARARSDKLASPVDLGTILVPADWLLLAPGQKTLVEIAAIHQTQDLGRVQAAAWFESSAKDKTGSELQLPKGKRVEAVLSMPATTGQPDRDVLYVNLTSSNGQELWHKKITTLRANRAPVLPTFGATSLKLRYDAPISVRDPKTGQMSSMDYEKAWAPELNDVVVSLPSGARFVFWRGSSYVPFWAGKHNTGLSYEWAETSPPPDGFVDSVEPLMDKELRYGRVQIIESTPSRVHVRWTYQSTDFTYKIWGDAPTEDFYFYPDGFGTRVLNLRSAPDANYELSEFIILAPQAAIPFSFIPRELVRVLELNGEKRELLFPGFHSRPTGNPSTRKPSDGPATSRLYRIRLHQDEEAAAIYFNPNDTLTPEELVAFPPFHDRGVMVTPAYWGSHWPLGRGNTTGSAIDDRIFLNPSHNSIMTWARKRPKPIRSAAYQSLDTLGRSKPMMENRWVWLIGMSNASDNDLLDRARSFARPPSVKVEGGTLDDDAYVPERRAIRLRVDKKQVTLNLKPVFPGPVPVFELLEAPKELVHVKLGDRVLAAREYAWDGQALWLDSRVETETALQLDFQ